ncbi:MAG: GTP 3',8-cyclase MoaA [Phycisphaerae bacterium]|nr:GTP 3',8-cyclase MoaA [Phycisphaerae bacterium]NNF44661.1 GTP 3',8-cyclase MoaA [Phycisphaerales bacterium]
MPPRAPDDATRSNALFDAYGRVIRDLRLSVTDRCNYRCIYCMDPDHRYLPKQQLLSVDQYLTIARVCADLGVRKVRVTGGEPTLYPHLQTLLEGLGRLPFDDVAMTTNGSLLTADRAARWRAAGLHRITMSLDSLRADRVAAITRQSVDATTVTRAIAVAREAGFDPIKVNAVVMRSINDDELADFADFAREYEIDMRLIEWMPLDSGRTWDRERVVTADEMLAAIRARHDLVPLGRDDAHGTSLNFGFPGGSRGRLGIIASVTRPFCGACSRLRTTADGKVRPCLFSHEEWNLRPLLRRHADDDEITRFLVDAMWTKQAGHGIGDATFAPPARGMSAIGG